MVESGFTPSHAYPFETLLNKPFTRAFYQTTADRQSSALELLVVNVFPVLFQVVVKVSYGLER